MSRLLATSLQSIDAAIGVCYGNKGDNLPSVQEVISLYQKYNITTIRIYDPNPEVLRALQGTNIQLSLDITADNIPNLASSQAAADSYICDHIQPYIGGVKLRYIAVGNKVDPVVPAIKNIQRSISAIGFNDTKVTTCFKYNLNKTIPPSAGSFSLEYESVLRPLVNVLKTNGAPYMVNVYPFFAYKFRKFVTGRTHEPLEIYWTNQSSGNTKFLVETAIQSAITFLIRGESHLDPDIMTKNRLHRA